MLVRISRWNRVQDYFEGCPSCCNNRASKANLAQKSGFPIFSPAYRPFPLTRAIQRIRQRHPEHYGVSVLCGWLSWLPGTRMRWWRLGHILQDTSGKCLSGVGEAECLKPLRPSPTVRPVVEPSAPPPLAGQADSHTYAGRGGPERGAGL